MTGWKPAIRCWLWGLVSFVIVITISLAITWPETVVWGILDHQAAGSAARVDEIQAQWRSGGVHALAVISMLGDLVFIAIYGVGSWIAGRSFMSRNGSIRMLGTLITVSSLVFLLTDYTETILQLVQLLRDQGSDWMAAIAATVRPVKIISWIATFGGVLMALAIHRFGSPTA